MRGGQGLICRHRPGGRRVCSTCLMFSKPASRTGLALPFSASGVELLSSAESEAAPKARLQVLSAPAVTAGTLLEHWAQDNIPASILHCTNHSFYPPIDSCTYFQGGVWQSSLWFTPSLGLPRSFRNQFSTTPGLSLVSVRLLDPVGVKVIGV